MTRPKTPEEIADCMRHDIECRVNRALSELRDHSFYKYLEEQGAVEAVPRPANRERFASPVFGSTERPSAEERALLARLAEEIPLGLFQALNKAMNARGAMISIVQDPAQGERQ